MENIQLEHKNIESSRPPLESTPVGVKTSDAKIPEADLTPVGAKMSDPKTPGMEPSERKEKARK